MPSGRKPIPVKLKRLHGDTRTRGRHRQLLPVEPEGRGALWAPPAWFDEAQREQWHYALDHAPAGLLTGTDRGTLAIWCAASVEHARAAVKVRELGQVIETKAGNVIQNPHLGIMNRQAQTMLRAGSDLGFSPAARASLGARAPEFARLPGPDGARSAGRGSLAQYLEQKPDRLQ